MSNELNYIGCVGRIKSGKDTVALMIKEESKQFEWSLGQMAGKLKESVALLYGVEVKDLNDHNFKENMMYNFSTGETRCRNEIDNKNTLIVEDAEHLRSLIQRMMKDIWASFRTILQYEGGHIGRDNRNENFWLNLAFKNNSNKVIYTDVRHINEFQGIQKQGILIRIYRPETDIKSGNHTSETEMDQFKWWNEEIMNDGSLEDLREKVKEIVKKYNL